MNNFEKISPTAKMVAYWRQFSDIPFSKDVAALFDVKNVVEQYITEEQLDEQTQMAATAHLELRYKCLLDAIKKSAVKQVLEFASGISLRGLNMTSDAGVTYIETDLPELNNEKLKIISALMKKCGIAARSNLFMETANILSWNDIESTLKHFDTNKPVVILHEGLFQYLTKDEKAVAAKNIHRVLKKYGGLWMTPDLDTRSSLSETGYGFRDIKKLLHAFEQATDRDFAKNAFETEEEILDFFGSVGFTVTARPQMNDDIHLSSLATNEAPAQLKNNLSSLRLWTMTAI